MNLAIRVVFPTRVQLPLGLVLPAPLGKLDTRRCPPHRVRPRVLPIVRALVIGLIKHRVDAGNQVIHGSPFPVENVRKLATV